MDEYELEENGSQSKNKEEIDCEIQRILYHNNLLLFRLEEAESNKEYLRIEIAMNQKTKKKKKRSLEQKFKNIKS